MVCQVKMWTYRTLQSLLRIEVNGTLKSKTDYFIKHLLLSGCNFVFTAEQIYNTLE